MSFKKLSFFLLLPCIYQFAAAQHADTLHYYLNSDQQPAEKAKAAYVVNVYKEKQGDVLWKRDYLTNVDHKLLSTGYSKDSLGKIKQGHFSFFSYKGELIQTTQYENDKVDGEFIQQFPSGKIQSRYHYSNGKLVGLSKSWYESGILRDSFDLDKNGNGYGVGYYESGLKTYEGQFEKGVKKGVWKYYYNETGSQQSMEGIFEHDSLISSKCFTKKGKPQSKDCVYEREANFDGGGEAWVKYLTQSILKSKYTKFLSKGSAYTVVIKFIVSTSGEIKEAIAETVGNEKLDRIAEKIISNSPAWIPAMQYNRPVNAYRRQPITFVTVAE